jgi:hypothetical protein
MSKATLMEQLALLKGMTLRTGAIHEAQALQLKMWPMMIPDVDKAEAQVDTERKIVTYKCEAGSTRATKKKRETMDNIVTWTRKILWDDTVVVFILNNKTVYDTRNIE